MNILELSMAKRTFGLPLRTGWRLRHKGLGEEKASDALGVWAGAFLFYGVSGFANDIKVQGRLRPDLGSQMKFILSS